MSTEERSVRRVAPMLLLAGQPTDDGVDEVPPAVIVNCWRNPKAEPCELPVPQSTGSLNVRRTCVEMSVVVLARVGLVVSGATVPVTVSAPGKTWPVMSWILLAPPAEQPRQSVAAGMAVIVSGSCSPGVEPSLLAAAGGVVTVTVTTTAVCAGFQTQLTLDPHTQLPTPFVVPGSLSVVWV